MLKRYLDDKGELGGWAGRNTIKATHWGRKRRQDPILIGKLHIKNPNFTAGKTR
jgi:hypothetical protein